MKKMILVAFVAILSVLSYGQDKGIKFTEGTLTELRAQAKKDKKLIFIDVYATWCGPCKALAANIFPLEEVGKYMNKNYVNAKFDAEKGEGIEIAKAYQVKAYPTMLILNDMGVEVGRVVGGDRTGESFINRVKENSVVKK